MAWQEPKTNWTGSDGVRDTDLNRIEGNILELHNRVAQTGITVYVTPTGNDATGDGTSSAPFRTINKALSSLPRDTNGKNVVVNVAAGTYAEDVLIAGFTGHVTITAPYGAYVSINSLTIDACSVRAYGLSLNVSSGGVTITNGSSVVFDSALTITNNTTGLSVVRGSVCVVDAALNVYEAAEEAVHVNESSRFYALSMTASDSPIAILCEQGSTAAFAATTIDVTAAAFVTRGGGRIYTGAQTSIGNY